MATADTPDSQAETTKVNQPVEQNNDSPKSEGEAMATARATPEVVEAAAPEATEATPVAEAAPAAAEAVAEVSETSVTEDTTSEVAAEVTAEVVEATPEAAAETENLAGNIMIKKSEERMFDNLLIFDIYLYNDEPVYKLPFISKDNSRQLLLQEFESIVKNCEYEISFLDCCSSKTFNPIGSISIVMVLPFSASMS